MATIQFKEFHQVKLPALRQPLEAIANAAESWLLKQGCGVAQGSLIEDFKNNYTMMSEREVFAKVTGAIRSMPQPPASATPGSDRNIELSVNALAKQDTGVPLEEEPRLIPAGVAAEATGLGANVELF